ncbi:sensor histidine kinase [soil metagenome]
MLRRLTTLQLTADVGIAIVCLLLRFTMSLESPGAVVTVVAMAVALAIRRLSPGLALAVAWVGAIVQMLSLLPPDFSNIAILAVLFTTARYGSSRVRWLGLASAGVGALVAVVYLFFAPYSSLPNGGLFTTEGSRFALGVSISLGAALAVLGLSWTLGLLARTWANARQSRREKVEAEREVVVEQERNRIARDMHDVVAHSLAVVIAQADGARYAASGDPTAVDGALATISATAREALGDVRLLLGQLRHNQGSGPQPALADLGALIDQVRGSGLDVDFEESGSPLPLAAGPQLALYRIAQEALTNALRHGDTSSPVSVRLRWVADAASLVISNSLTSATQGAPGHGLAGMRERAQLVGGNLTALAEGDSFVVSARIPAHAQVTA